MVTMDKAGRIVIPKEVRDSLDLAANAEFDLVVEGYAIQIKPRQAPPRRLAWTEDGRPYFPAMDDHVLTDADVQRFRAADQR